MTKHSRSTNALTWQPRCPINAEHGRLIDYPTGFFCPHADHRYDAEIPWFSPSAVGAYDARTATQENRP